MKTPFGHLTYCTNIHSGETWAAHFAELQLHIPAIKQKISPNGAFGIGLRLSNIASLDLMKDENLEAFKGWLAAQGCYVYTINGFPYGSFHGEVVKDKVHLPDWLTHERVFYTNRLITILGELLPEGMEGSISTSPLSYKYWHNSDADKQLAYEQSALNILRVVEQCSEMKALFGKTIHIDIEPEPDGLVETIDEFIAWYNTFLLPKAYGYFEIKFGYLIAKIEAMIKRYIRLCYDVCHVAVGFTDHKEAMQKLANENIAIGKIQLSAAIKAYFNMDKTKLRVEIERFVEPTYLHQVVAKMADGSMIHYPDLPDALEEVDKHDFKEWRAHFHVPIFLENYGMLQSTQKDILEVLAIQKQSTVTSHLEIETYTWDVLPLDLKLPLNESIVRELDWVLKS